MNISVIGLGQRGYNYIRWIKIFVPSIGVSAICDKNTFRADETAERFNVKHKFYDEDVLFN